ncbi:MAG: hypothetical protein WA736_13610 [Candidatus Acidiferrum sp.]
MPSLSSKDRVSLCRFTFDDGRRCRTPRISTSPDFCFYHAQKEAQSRANEKIANDLAFFFSGDYLSANNLNTALSRVFVAVARGDIKPRAARTLAYLAQTMFQTLHLAQDEFITACGEKDWRHTVVQSINANHKYRFPSPSQPAPPQTPAQPTMPTQPESAAPQSQIPPQPATSPQACHPERSEGSRQDPDPSTYPKTRLCPAPPPALTPHANSPSVVVGLARPEPPSTRVASQPQPSAPPTAQSAPPSRLAVQNRDPYAVHYGPNCRLLIDGKSV